MKKVLGWKKIEIVCVIIVVAFMSFLIGIYYQSRTERGSIRSLCSGWYQMKDGKRIELELPCSVTADAEGKVILYNDTLTEDDRGLIVSTRGIQDNLEIRTGERILYHYADNQFQKNKQMKAKMWADVRLPEETGQEPLCFIYDGTAGRSLDIQVPILGSFSAIVVRHLQASAFSILMIISMLGLGIVAVSIFLYTRHRQLVEKRFVNVAVFLIICSLWCILDSGIYQMYGKHSAAGSLVSFYAFMLMSVPMLHFIQNTVSKENQWIPEIWILLFYGNAIGQGIVNIWFAVPFKNMLFVTHLILFTGVAAMAILLWREYQKHQTQELELCLKAFGVLGISGVIALALYWMYAIYWYDALFQFGILLFISFLFWGLLCKVSNDIQYRMEQAVYERMSIEDRMTGMKNRKAFEQQLDQLQQDIFHIFSDITGFRQCRRIRDRKRYINDLCKCLRQKCLTAACWSDHDDIALLQLHIIQILICGHTLIMIINSHRQYLLGFLLPYHIIIQKLFDLYRFEQVNIHRIRGFFLFVFFFNNICTQIHAFITDINACRACDHLAHLILCFIAKRTSDFCIRTFSCHFYAPTY